MGDLQEPPSLALGRVRQAGGGRKLGAWQIAQRLLEAGYTVSRKFACDNLYRWWVQHGKPQCHLHPAIVRRWRQQQCQPLYFQGRFAETGGAYRCGNPHRPLPALHLQVQPDRTPPVPACSRLSPVPVRAWCLTHCKPSKNGWQKPKPARV